MGQDVWKEQMHRSSLSPLLKLRHPSVLLCILAFRSSVLDWGIFRWLSSPASSGPLSTFLAFQPTSHTIWDFLLPQLHVPVPIMTVHLLNSTFFLRSPMNPTVRNYSFTKMIIAQRCALWRVRIAGGGISYGTITAESFLPSCWHPSLTLQWQVQVAPQNFYKVSIHLEDFLLITPQSKHPFLWIGRAFFWIGHEKAHKAICD